MEVRSRTSRRNSNFVMNSNPYSRSKNLLQNASQSILQGRFTRVPDTILLGKLLCCVPGGKIRVNEPVFVKIGAFTYA